MKLSLTLTLVAFLFMACSEPNGGNNNLSEAENIPHLPLRSLFQNVEIIDEVHIIDQCDNAPDLVMPSGQVTTSDTTNKSWWRSKTIVLTNDISLEDIDMIIVCAVTPEAFESCDASLLYENKNYFFTEQILYNLIQIFGVTDLIYASLMVWDSGIDRNCNSDRIIDSWNEYRSFVQILGFIEDELTLLRFHRWD